MNPLSRFVSGAHLRLKIAHAFYCDMRRYIRYSGTVRIDTKGKLLGQIMLKYHVVEKGLTMPAPRLGFGRDNLAALIARIKEYVERYGLDHPQVRNGAEIVNEYALFHRERGYELDTELQQMIVSMNRLIPDIGHTDQPHISRMQYFRNLESAFPLFAASRHSVRNFTAEPVDTKALAEALDMARTAPSACNRQMVKVHVYSDKESIARILSLQGGNRGFGHLTDKLLIVTSNLEFFFTTGERNESYVDGGIYVMNLLYSLHYKRIGACTLNCCFTPSVQKKLHETAGIPPRESFVAMIACGVVPEEARLAGSFRTPYPANAQWHGEAKPDKA